MYMKNGSNRRVALKLVLASLIMLVCVGFFKTDVKAATNTNDRTIYINLAAQKVAVFKNGEALPEKVFLCSTGKFDNTPVGSFKSENFYYDWHELYGSVYSYGAIRIKGSFLIHSVPELRPIFGTTDSVAYNKLGTKDSLGCVRLTQRDLNYLLTTTSVGVPIVIINDPNTDWVLTESYTKVDESSAMCYDPSIDWSALGLNI